MNSISQSFELRYFSQNTKANGETDFKGDTSTLDTEQRVSFLEEYARQMEKDNKQIDLDQPIVTKAEVELVMNKLKKQPLPGDRKRIILDVWKWIGDEANQKVETYEKRLYFLEDNTLTIPILTQDWRCFFEWKIARGSNYENSSFSIGEAVMLGFDQEKRLYYITDTKTTIGSQFEGDICIKVELDFINSKYNVYVNQNVVADFVPFSIMNRKNVDSIIILAQQGMKIEYIWGQGYKRLEDNEFEPFLVQTCIDLSIREKIAVKGWKRDDYDDVQ